MKTALLILQFTTLCAIAIITGYTVSLLSYKHLLLAFCSWGTSIPAIFLYIKTTDKLWFNKEDHHA